LKKKLAILTTQIDHSKNQSSSNVSSEQIAARDQLKQDIESILAAECPSCGSLMIQKIDKSFANSDEQW
jgi:hypothetical protein